MTWRVALRKSWAGKCSECGLYTPFYGEHDPASGKSHWCDHCDRVISKRKWALHPSSNISLLQQVKLVLDEQKEAIDEEIKRRAEPPLLPPDRPTLAGCVSTASASPNGLFLSVIFSFTGADPLDDAADDDAAEYDESVLMLLRILSLGL